MTCRIEYFPEFVNADIQSIDMEKYYHENAQKRIKSIIMI